jgi:hypothetical protein
MKNKHQSKLLLSVMIVGVLSVVIILVGMIGSNGVLCPDGRSPIIGSNGDCNYIGNDLVIIPDYIKYPVERNDSELPNDAIPLVHGDSFDGSGQTILSTVEFGNCIDYTNSNIMRCES